MSTAAAATYPIIGIQDGRGPNGAVPVRYEILRFANPNVNVHAKEQLNLFLQALERFHATPHEELLSWFKIAGIHGQPYENWDGSKGDVDTSDKDQWLGYCTHASILFPTWHRVYCALVEQVIHKHMKDILNEYPTEQQQALKPAVDAWRLPYWDWALHSPGSTKLFVPELLQTRQIEVQRPSGITDKIDNPLYRYKFPLNQDQQIVGIDDVLPEEEGDPYVPFSQTPYTIRHPDEYDTTKPFSEQVSWAQGISNNADVANSLNNGIKSGTRERPGGRDLVHEVYKLTTSRDYPAFSNTRWVKPATVDAKDSPKKYMSLEGVHNNVHVFIGGTTNGHMGWNQVAAFDPIFWMHHCNIDRLLSIFQALNPEDYKNWPNDPWLSKTINPWFTGISEIDVDGTWTEPHGKIAETTTTPLTPFHTDTKATYWTSDACRDTKALGYGYEELQDWDPIFHDASGKFNEPLFCKAVRLSAIAKYGWAVPTRARLAKLQVLNAPSVETEAEEAKEEAVFAAKSTIAKHVFAEIDVPFKVPLYYANVPEEERQFNEYVVNARVDRFAVAGRTFVIHIFLGDVPQDYNTWEAAPERVGVITIFGGALFSSGKCSNCNKQAELDETRLVTGQWSITNALLDVIEAGKPVSGVTLESLSTEDVSKFLKSALHWRVTAVGIGEYDVKNIPSLDVSVAVSTATLPAHEGDFVEYGEYEVLTEATLA